MWTAVFHLGLSKSSAFGSVEQFLEPLRECRKQTSGGLRIQRRGDLLFLECAGSSSGVEVSN
jgi:hypothetical protein